MMFRRRKPWSEHYVEVFAEAWHTLPLDTQELIRREAPAFAYLCQILGMQRHR